MVTTGRCASKVSIVSMSSDFDDASPGSSPPKDKAIATHIEKSRALRIPDTIEEAASSRTHLTLGMCAPNAPHPNYMCTNQSMNALHPKCMCTGQSY